MMKSRKAVIFSFAVSLLITFALLYADSVNATAVSWFI